MPDTGRVVIRSSWPASLAFMAPAAVVLLAYQVFARSAGGVGTILVVLVTMLLTLRLVTYVELTAQGLDIHTFGMRRIPWQQIGSVELVSRQGGHQLRIYDLAEKRTRFLPAPRGAFGVGKKEAAEARDLIERSWLAHRGSPPPVAAPPLPPAEPIDPYRPPREG
jgi:hypothetical protein